MAATKNKINLGGLARKLILDNILTEKKAEEAYKQALSERIPFVTYLVNNGMANDKEIAKAASEEFGVPLLDLAAIDIDKEVLDLVANDLIEKHHVLPIFKRGKRIFIAVSDPTNIHALDEIKFHVGTNTEMVVAEERKLARIIDDAVDEASFNFGDEQEDEFSDYGNLDFGEGKTEDEDSDNDVDDTPVVRFINKTLLDAIKKGASDLHFEPYEKFFRVRFRVDGVLHEVTKPPLGLSSKISARIKVMSRLDVSERRVPQDGRIKLKISKNKAIDFRVSTCPTLYGEKAVLRILDSDSAKLGIDALGYEDDQKKLFLENLHKPYGMFLVTGPTGSGKTVSLYSGINILNKQDINISTAEDPVEINLPGVNQVQVDEKTGMTFPKALKAFLRQDPDVILVGEIRDLETGSIAVKAAQTGHMVMSTLHTNDGPQTLTRLKDMGIPAFAVATSINIIVAQRLARRLCPHCKHPIETSKDQLLAEGFSDRLIDQGITLFDAEGCDECSEGYKGRTGIYQVMPISDAMKRLIMDDANAVTLADQARSEGIADIRQSGLKKVFDGVTSMKEINRVTVE